MTARHALGADVPALSRALAEAFADDPMITWVVGIDDREARVAAADTGFFAPSTSGGLKCGHAYTVGPVGGSLAGGALWTPPDVELFGEQEINQLTEGLMSVAGEAALGRLMALGELVGRHHPTEPHFYLFLLGAVEKGTGVGSAVLQPVLERCDADGLPAYLESSSARNLSFYARHGFEVTWEEAVEGGGPMMRGMWRHPGSGRG
jgi:GNAT superfamily N-acetyltransferase